MLTEDRAPVLRREAARIELDYRVAEALHGRLRGIGFAEGVLGAAERWSPDHDSPLDWSVIGWYENNGDPLLEVLQRIFEAHVDAISNGVGDVAEVALCQALGRMEAAPLDAESRRFGQFYEGVEPRATSVARTLIAAGAEVCVFDGPVQMAVWHLVLVLAGIRVVLISERGFADAVTLHRADDAGEALRDSDGAKLVACIDTVVAAWLAATEEEPRMGFAEVEALERDRGLAPEAPGALRWLATADWGPLIRVERLRYEQRRLRPGEDDPAAPAIAIDEILSAYRR